MKTVVLDKPFSFRLTETEPPGEPGQGEALVRVQRVGICGTDLHAYQGNQPFFDYPRILGHELAVEIVALGPSAEAHGLAVGDRCAVEPYLNCGTCIACRRGRTNCCERLSVLGVHQDGGMREQVIVPIAKLHKANGVPPEQLALGRDAAHRRACGASCAPAIEPGEPALVIGAGPIGLGTMQFARALGAEVIAMDINGQRLAFCQENLGIQRMVDARRRRRKCATRWAATCRRWSSTLRATRLMMDAFNYAAHSGRIVYVGLVKGELTFS